MSPTIRISEVLYKRLETHAHGFDTPAGVIERILDAYESKENVQTTKSLKPEPAKKRAHSIEIVLFPSDKIDFKKQLLISKMAYVRLHKTDGTIVNKTWNASRFDEHSDVMNNLRSGYLRGWRDRGIVKAEISIDKLEN